MQVERLRTRRSARSLAAAAATLALVVGVATAGGAAAAAAPPPAAVVLATDVDASPAGTLDTTTYALGRGDVGRDGAQHAGWSTGFAVPAGTQQVALSWRGDPQAQFAVRTRASAGAPWSEALRLEGELGDDGPDAGVGNGRSGAGPLWLGTAGVGRVEVRLVNGMVADLRLDAMAFRSPAVGTRAAGPATAKPATPAGGPTIRLRSSWAPGGWVRNPGCSAAPTTNADLLHAVVHHTETPNGYAASAVPGILAGIYRYHTVTRGWCDIAYNLFVDRFGGVWEGRSGGLDNAVQGGHSSGFNDHSVGVALIGSHEPGSQFGGVVPPAAELAALRDVLAWKLGSQGIDPRASVAVPTHGNARFAAGTVRLPAIGGHGDNGYTSCPGALVRTRLPQLRVDVANRIAATNDATRWRPHGTGARYWAQVAVDAEGRIDRQSRIGAYTSAVVRAGYPQSDLTAGLVLSPTTDGRVGVVDRLSRAALGTAPGTALLATNVANRDRGVSTTTLAGNFLASSAYRARYGTPDDRTFVALVFRNALGRTATTADLDRWVARLADGLPRRDLLLQVAQSAEARLRSSTATRVTTAFFVMVRRAPTDASRAYWEPRLAAGTPNRDLVLGLLRSTEYVARFPA